MSEILPYMYIGLHVKYPLFLSDCNNTWITSTDFKNQNFKFNENPSSGSRVVPRERADKIKKKLTATFLNFSENA